MSRSWYSMTLTEAGWAAVRARSLDPSVPPPGVPFPCPGWGERTCLAVTPNGRMCHYCLGSMDRDLESLPYTLRTTEPTLRSTQPLADPKGGPDAG